MRGILLMSGCLGRSITVTIDGLEDLYDEPERRDGGEVIRGLIQRRASVGLLQVI